ncbi:unnamed protein product [Oikopleura dioica]|uniref:Uncharacterized protein n=1 Tax=Oikopleura dioica TaxID=34765 RepID=E4WRK9_OIKDI|nr:unnamed protein product [Oikopleura dioica]
MEHREKPILKSGTKMVVRRPDGLGTAQVTSEKLKSTTLPEVSLDSMVVRPHSTVQRAHSTVIPRGSKSKKIAPDLLTNNANGNGALQSSSKENKNLDILSTLGQFQGLDSLLKSQAELNGKQRVGVNPVLGNAGLMWESVTKRNSVPQVTVSSDFCSLLNKRKSSTPDIFNSKRPKFEADCNPSTDELGARRKELDNYTGCLPAHMLHLLPMSQKAEFSANQNGQLNSEMSADLSVLLQQYQALNAAAGLAGSPDLSTNLLSGGIDTSAILQLQLLQAFQRQTAGLAALPSFSMPSATTSSYAENPSLQKTPTQAQTTISFPVTSPYKITPVKRKTEKSKVKCLKTAEIPKIAQAELDSNVKLSSFSGITMTPSMSKRPSIPTELLQPFQNSKVASSTASPSPELWLKLIGSNQSKCVSAMLHSAGARAEIKITLPSGESQTFNGTCSAAKKKSNRLEVEVVEPLPEPVIPDVSILGHNLASLQAQARLLASSLGAQACSVATTNPFSISQILPNFSLDLPSIPPLNLTPITSYAQPENTKWKTPSPLKRESSPEIIVDKLTPEENSQKENSHNLNSTPTRNKGPKKNFLARQAALDAKMNVLRAKAESDAASNTDEGDPVKLEMSDSEIIEPHLDI